MLPPRAAARDGAQSKLQVEALHLQHQNVEYQRMQLLKDIGANKQFKCVCGACAPAPTRGRSRDEDIVLVGEVEFRAAHPDSVFEVL